MLSHTFLDGEVNTMHAKRKANRTRDPFKSKLQTWYVLLPLFPARGPPGETAAVRNFQFQ